MNLSVIVPCLNEGTRLIPLCEDLKRQSISVEVIFADGGSTDGSVDSLPLGRVVTSQPGRARQMNCGAAAACGDSLLFLHADSRVGPETCASIVELLQGGASAGCLTLAFDSRRWLLKLCAALSNRRVQRRAIAFGDQAIFVKRSVFKNLGGFVDQPLMEDYQFSLDLKKAAIPLIQSTCIVTTSARRFERHGFWRTVLLMQSLQWLYRSGVSPWRLAQFYREPHKAQTFR